MCYYSCFANARCWVCLTNRAVARTLIGGGGVYSYIRVLPDYLLLKSILFQKKLVEQNLNIAIATALLSNKFL